MKKLFILFLALGLLSACNSNKGPVPKNNTDRSKDDYRDKPDDKNNNGNSNDDRNNNNNNNGNDNSNNDRNNDRTNNNNNGNNNNGNNNNDGPVNNDRTNTGGGWGSANEQAFTTNCVSSAVNSGLEQRRAQNYCDCMLGKLERKYPDPNDVAGLDENSPVMKQMAQDCIGGN